jgi:hypothetical protein
MRILEGIVTTLNEDGTVNVSPMGPRVDGAMERFELLPFQSSTTYRNLKRHGEGVFHVTDDVEMLARAAVDQLEPLPATFPAQAINGEILCDACRWYAFRVLQLDDAESRALFLCKVVDRGRLRDFFGFNRAKHAVIEAAILATRIKLLPSEEIFEAFERLKPIVSKTGAEHEVRAFALLENFVDRSLNRRG